MTYVDWNKADRALHTPEDYRRLPEYVLSLGPFLTTWFAAHDFTGRRVLDLGYGSGVFSSLLARKGGQVTAVDLTEAGVKMAAEVAAAQNVAVSIARMDAEKLAFRDAVFDFVHSWGVLHNTGNSDFGLPGPGARHRLDGRAATREFFKLAVPFSPGYGRQDRRVS